MSLLITIKYSRPKGKWIMQTLRNGKLLRGWRLELADLTRMALEAEQCAAELENLYPNDGIVHIAAEPKFNDKLT